MGRRGLVPLPLGEELDRKQVSHWLLPGVCSLASMTSSKSLSALKNLDSSYNLFLKRDGHTASVSLQH